MPSIYRYRSVGVVFLLLLMILAIRPVFGATAAPLGDPVNAVEAKAGTLLVRAQDDRVLRPVPMLGTEVDIQVTGVVARTVVTQYFHNPTDLWLEGVYVFPLPENAAVDTLEVRIGDRIIVGEIKERAEAKKIYEKAKAQGKKAALLEQERANIFTTSVAGIPPEGMIGVRIEYQRELLFRDGVFSLRFPMVVAPRYVPGDKAIGISGHGFSPDTDQVPDGSRITPVVAPSHQKPINPVKLTATINAGMAISVQSPSHVIGISESQAGIVEIAFADGAVPADRDFVLNWRPVMQKTPKIALFTEHFQGEDYRLLMVMPPQADVVAKSRLDREVIFVLDRSGSMAGTSFEQARAALTMALKRLSPRDSFNLIAFSSVSRQLFVRPMPATSANIEKAIEGINALTAEGGTEMLAALKLALDDQGRGEKVRQVVFMTDGSVGNEDALFEFIGQRIGASRLFTIGIGSAPNGHFMKRAAILGKGTFTHIGKHYEVNQEMTALFKRLESPVLTDIRFDWPGDSPESYPAPIPDLYAGEPLVVLFKAKDLDKEIVINASVGSKKWNQRVSLKGGLTQAGIARLYARRKIDAIELSFNELVSTLNWQGARRKIKEEVTKTGLQYQLVTKHTSLVAVEKESSVPFEEKLKTWSVPINLPEGWQHGSAWEQPAQDLIVEDATAMMAPLANVEYERVNAFAELYDLRYDLRKEAKVVRGEREVQLIAENGANHKRKAEKARPYAKKNPLPQTDSPAPSAMQIAMAQILPRTATPAQLFMIIGALLLLTALLFRRRLFSRW